MYRELTDNRNRSIKRLVMGVILVIILVTACCAAYQVAHDSTKEQGAASVRQSILDAATQCAAVEGAYPSSLEHLESAYGVRINRQEYNVIFEPSAANMPPSVVVTPR